MQKLLLLTISMVSFSLNDFASGFQPGDSTKTDTTTSRKIVDPKEGFKDLFVMTTTINGFNATKLNPLAVSFVQDYMDKFGNRLSKMRDWGRPYFDVMNNILIRHGLPSELKYLSVIESDLKSYAVSWAGAVGPWQFMAGTARGVGLKVNNKIDERTDIHKSTHAAARYLTQLFGTYKDWLLVIAAYNCGPGVVNSAIRKSGSRNFWNLQYFLPAESRNHVKKFIATHYIMEGDGGVTTLTKKETERYALNASPIDTNTKIEYEEMNVSGRYNSMVIAQFTQMNIAEFNSLNPNFDKALSSSGSFNLRLPPEKLLLFLAKKPQILEQSIKVMLMMDGN